MSLKLLIYCSLDFRFHRMAGKKEKVYHSLDGEVWKWGRGAQRVTNLPAMQETWVQSLGQEDPLEKEIATHSSILAWRIPWTEEPDELQSMGLQRVGHNWVTNAFTSFHFRFLEGEAWRWGRGAERENWRHGQHTLATSQLGLIITV